MIAKRVDCDPVKGRGLIGSERRTCRRRIGSRLVLKRDEHESGDDEETGSAVGREHAQGVLHTTKRGLANSDRSYLSGSSARIPVGRRRPDSIGAIRS
jgi:hypothetical protein